MSEIKGVRKPSTMEKPAFYDNFSKGGVFIQDRIKGLEKILSKSPALHTYDIYHYITDSLIPRIIDKSDQCARATTVAEKINIYKKAIDSLLKNSHNPAALQLREWLFQASKKDSFVNLIAEKYYYNGYHDLHGVYKIDLEGLNMLKSEISGIVNEGIKIAEHKLNEYRVTLKNCERYKRRTEKKQTQGIKPRKTKRASRAAETNGDAAGKAIKKTRGASGGAKFVGKQIGEEGVEGLGKAWRTVRKFGQEVFEFVIKRAH